MSPTNVSRMLHRFSLSEDKRMRRLAALRQRRLHDEGEEATFAPAVSPRSQAIAAELPDFLSRQQLYLQHRERRLEEQRQRRRREESQSLDAQSQSQVRTPCVCGANEDRTAKEYAAEESHSPKCRRFQALCTNSKKKNSTKVQPQRSLDDILAFEHEKRRKHAARLAIQRAREAQESTFAPQINPMSTRIYEEMRRRRREREKVEPVDLELLHEDEWEDTEQALKPPPSDIQEVTTHQRVSIVLEPRRRPRSSRGLTLGVAPAAFSESLWTQPMQQSPPQSRKAIELVSPSKAHQSTIPLDRPAHVRWTTVTFDADAAGFILDNFEIPRP
ncbi:hypothetical protein PINS_up007644 [Pythium insidiosum]|nr:hypothetical protein PINS_up007644 [Pythium insidiosum]